MPVVMITGTLGSGKTLLMTKLLKDKFDRKHSIYSNYNLNFKFEVITKEHIKNYGKWDYNDCCIGIDELQVMLDSRTSMSAKNKILSYWFLQTRKRNVHLYFTTQFSDQVEKRLRRIVDIWIECNKIVAKDKKKKVIVNEKGETVYIISYTIMLLKNRKLQKPIKKFLIANKYYDLYDTNEIIAFEDW